MNESGLRDFVNYIGAELQGLRKEVRECTGEVRTLKEATTEQLQEHSARIGALEKPARRWREILAQPDTARPLIFAALVAVVFVIFAAVAAPQSLSALESLIRSMRGG